MTKGVRPALLKCPIHRSTHILRDNMLLIWKSLQEYNGAMWGSFVTFSAQIGNIMLGTGIMCFTNWMLAHTDIADTSCKPLREVAYELL